MTRALVLCECSALGQPFCETIRELAARFDHVTVAVDERPHAQHTAPLALRWAAARACLAHLPNVWVTALVDAPGLSLPRDRVASLGVRLGAFTLLVTDAVELLPIAAHAGMRAALLPAFAASEAAHVQPVRRALVVSRAQPFHRGHRALVEHAFTHADEVIFVIAAAERAYSAHDPFSAGERLALVRAGLDAYAARTWLLALPAPVWPALALLQLAFVAPPYELVVAHNPILRSMAAAAGKIALGLAAPVEVTGQVLNGSRIRARLAREGAGPWLHDVLPEPCARMFERDESLRERCAVIAAAEV